MASAGTTMGDCGACTNLMPRAGADRRVEPGCLAGLALNLCHGSPQLHGLRSAKPTGVVPRAAHHRQARPSGMHRIILPTDAANSRMHDRVPRRRLDGVCWRGSGRDERGIAMPCSGIARQRTGLEGGASPVDAMAPANGAIYWCAGINMESQRCKRGWARLHNGDTSPAGAAMAVCT